VPGAVGGANWGNTAADPARGIVYVLNQDFPSFLRLEPPAPPRAESTASDGPSARVREAWAQSCAACHGDDAQGGMAPSLRGVGGRLTPADFRSMVVNGGAQMPAFNHIEDDVVRALFDWLGGDSPGFRFAPAGPPVMPEGPVVASGGAPHARQPARPLPLGYPEGDPPRVRYHTDYGLGHPYIMAPPWSTLTAYDLNTGTIRWQVPIGQDSAVAAEGGSGTGVPRGTQRNGMIVTRTGIVFATAKDGHVYAFDSDDGRVLWSAKLPMGTEGLPAMYAAGGKQYLVVNATTPLTWGKKSRESGIGAEGPRGMGAYVVFALR
jgi:quinoprotein glucose dehydrogenase